MNGSMILIADGDLEVRRFDRLACGLPAAGPTERAGRTTATLA
jgi:hypothetical protein